jgi:hypothetical protein
MNDEEKKKLWETVCKDIEREVEKTYLNIPISKRIQLGVEPVANGKFQDSESYDRNRWLVCYINLMVWQKRAKTLFNQTHVFED